MNQPFNPYGPNRPMQHWQGYGPGQFPMHPPGGQMPFYPMQGQQRPPIPSLLMHFQKEDGKLDFDKMFATAGHVTNTVKQISPLFKMFGPK